MITLKVDKEMVHAVIEDPPVLITKSFPLSVFYAGLANITTLSTPLLPEGTRAYMRKGTRELYLFYSSPHIRVVKHITNDSRFKIPTPHTVLCLIMENGINEVYPLGVYMKALLSPLSSLSDTIYDFPFGNIPSRNFDHNNRGSVCFGGISIRDYIYPISVDTILDLYYSSYFNDDYNIPCYSIFSDLNNMLEFPNDKLVLDGRSVQQWMVSLLN